MVSAKEFEKLVNELLVMEKELDRLGKVRYTDTVSGEQYAMFEQAIAGSYQPQKEYNDYKKRYTEKKRIVDSLDMIARYKLALKT